MCVRLRKSQANAGDDKLHGNLGIGDISFGDGELN